MIASSLFHFTRRISVVKKILEGQSFRASYNIENVENLSFEYDFLAIPMVCFCDIPLKFISKDHVKRYGFFGFGLKKEWGIRNGINPVLYRTKNYPLENSFKNISNTTKQLHKKIEIYGSLNDNENSSSLLQMTLSTIQSHMTNEMCFVKPYEAAERNNYIDREWRWVPDSAEKNFLESDGDEVRKSLNTAYQIKPNFLKFDYGDINHLVVKNKKVVEQTIRVIGQLKIPDQQKFHLIQKVIDIESINLDM